MRFWDKLVGGGSILGQSLSNKGTECADRQIRLWLHIDMTGSFRDWRNNSPPELKKSLTALLNKYPNLKFGASGFGDRPAGSVVWRFPGQTENLCYVEGVGFDDPFGDAKFLKLQNMTSSQRNSFLDLEEDPLSAIPWIAKHKFGDYKDNELRIITLLTDYGPHYGPKYESGSDEPSKAAEDLVTCDATKRYATLNELFDPLKSRRILPLVTVYPGETCIEKWTEVLTEVGYDTNQQLINMGKTYELVKFTETIEMIIRENECKPAPTMQPSDHPHHTTHIALTEVDSANSHVKSVMIGAGAGAAALIAAIVFTAYRRTEPMLDVHEMGAEDYVDPELLDREAAIALSEVAYE